MKYLFATNTKFHIRPATIMILFNIADISEITFSKIFLNNHCDRLDFICGEDYILQDIQLESVPMQMMTDKIVIFSKEAIVSLAIAINNSYSKTVIDIYYWHAHHPSKSKKKIILDLESYFSELCL